MSVLDRYKIPISEIVPRNEEQKNCIEKMHTLLPWDEMVDVQKLYYQYNPCEMENIPYDLRIDPDFQERERAYFEGKKKMKELLKKPPWSLTILGSVGNGKTTLACGLVNEVKRRASLKCLYITQWDLLDAYRKNFDSKISYQCSETQLLVIDELTFLGMTDYGKAFIQSIINDRYTDDKKTILIGNISTDDFPNFFEPHIISRLREGLTMKMTAPDMRESDF